MSERGKREEKRINSKKGQETVISEKYKNEWKNGGVRMKGNYTDGRKGERTKALNEKTREEGRKERKNIRHLMTRTNKNTRDKASQRENMVRTQIRSIEREGRERRREQKREEEFRNQEGIGKHKLQE